MPIKSQEEFQNWLGQQSQKTCVLIASRAALRVYSVFTSEHRLEHQHAELPLVAARAILSAWVAATTRSPEVVQAARSAAYKATDSALIARPIALTIAVASSARSADTAINPKYSVANANRAIDAVREFDAWMGDEYVERGYFAEGYAAGSEMVDATYKDAGIDPDFWFQQRSGMTCENPACLSRRKKLMTFQRMAVNGPFGTTGIRGF